MNSPARTTRFRIITRGSLIRLAILICLVIALCFAGYFVMFRMPGTSYEGPPPPLSQQQAAMRDRLRDDVYHLAGTIGERNVFQPAKLDEAADWIETSLSGMGYNVQRQTYHVTQRQFGAENVASSNIEAELRGRTNADEIVIIGAHYDSIMGSPGANDNGSGVAAVLELARRFAHERTDRTVRFVLFVNEEPPFFQTDQMGSLVYAARSRERGENIVGMISLETIGYFSDAEGSQEYPLAPIGMMYPTRGDFIGFVSNVKSRRLLREIVGAFREDATIPSEGGSLFGGTPGVGWSDHWAFWQHGYPAVMVTDTALFRYPHYHLATDTPDKLDYDRLALVVEGMVSVVHHLAQSNPNIAAD